MKKFFTLGLLLALLAASFPLYADPGGSPGFAVQSSAIVPAATVFVASDEINVTAAADTGKPTFTQVAGGVVAVLGAILVVLVVPSYLSHLELFIRRRSKYLTMIRRAKRTKIPVLKMRLAS